MVGTVPPMSALVLAAATALSFVLAAPQAVRAVRHGTVGLHWTQDAVRVANKVVWVGFALAVADYGLAAVQVLISAASLVVLWRLWRDGRVPVRPFAALFAGAAALAAVTMAVGPAAAAWASVFGMTVDVVRYLPQLRVTFTAPSLSGVSVGTYLLQMCTSVLWGVYGWLADVPAMVVGNAVLLPLAAAIAVRVLVRRRLPAGPQVG